MGMFDYVNATINCPKCGTKITEFQSKSAGCNLLIVDPDTVNNFYTHCPQCDTWVEFVRPYSLKQTSRKTPYTEEEVRALGFKRIGEEDGED